MPLVIAIVSAVFVVVLAALLARFYFTDQRRMSSEVAGVIVGVEEQTVIEDDRRRPRTLVRVRYYAGGRDRELHWLLAGHAAEQLPLGRAIRVRYNPAQPEKATVPSMSHLKVRDVAPADPSS